MFEWIDTPLENLYMNTLFCGVSIFGFTLCILVLYTEYQKFNYLDMTLLLYVIVFGISIVISYVGAIYAAMVL